MQTSTLFDLKIFAENISVCSAVLEKALERSSSGKSASLCVVFTPNPEQVVLAQHNHIFKKDLQSADLLIPDGGGLVWASRALGVHKISHRISGREMLVFLMKRASELRLPVFLLGGRGASAAYAEKLRQSYSDLQIETDPGVQHVQTPSSEEEQRIEHAIARFKPAVVCVAYGAPHQERWVSEHRQFLAKNGVRVVLVVGGAMDTLTGRVAAPPKMFVALGLEWFWRLIQQPWRLKRQLALLEFVFLVLKQKFFR
jgi:N-acetylglucosaminyldiphosphoundecaprenol N-acetyl-beta-D-mannosaminyltransferase